MKIFRENSREIFGIASKKLCWLGGRGEKLRNLVKQGF